jgi:hypothetical protein
MADHRLVNVRCTMEDMLVFIIECIHYLLVLKISGSILANRSLCGRQSCAGPHLESA